jgi:hypothetical protein
MIDSPIYSALGRIRKILVFSPEPQKIEEVVFSEGIDNQLLRLVNSMPDIRHFLREKPIDLTILFDYDQTTYLPSFTPEDKVRFICSPYSECSVSTKWVQDTFHLVLDNNKLRALVLDQAYSYPLEDCAVDVLHKNQIFESWERITERIDGGNVMRGRCSKGKDYLIVGSEPHCIENDKILSLYFGIPEERIFRLKFTDPVVKEIFYHLDVFLMLIGALPNGNYSGKEAVCMAKVDENSCNIGRALNQAIDEVWEQLQAQSDNLFVRFDLPCIVVNSDTEKTYCYSACNGIVENYRDEKGDQILHIYFPRFREHAYADYENLNKTEKVEFMNYVKNMSYRISTKINYINPFMNVFERLDQLTDLKVNSISDIQFSGNVNKLSPLIQSQIMYHHLDRIGQWFLEEIRKVTAQISASDTHIYLNFQDDTRKQGGALHCRVKVIARDFVNLNLPAS